MISRENYSSGRHPPVSSVIAYISSTGTWPHLAAIIAGRSLLQHSMRFLAGAVDGQTDGAKTSMYSENSALAPLPDPNLAIHPSALAPSHLLSCPALTRMLLYLLPLYSFTHSSDVLCRTHCSNTYNGQAISPTWSAPSGVSCGCHLDSAGRPDGLPSIQRQEFGCGSPKMYIRYYTRVLFNLSNKYLFRLEGLLKTTSL